jgi:hypothetical protein
LEEIEEKLVLKALVDGRKTFMSRLLSIKSSGQNKLQEGRESLKRDIKQEEEELSTKN